MNGDTQELVDVLAHKHQLTKKSVRELLGDAVALVAELTWERGRFSWSGLGTFSVKHRKARNIRNPDTDLPMVAPAHRAVTCRVAKAWRRTDVGMPNETPERLDG
jgi:DNA-binding protein HU-beta